jgi:hypothetical protein
MISDIGLMIRDLAAYGNVRFPPIVAVPTDCYRFR